MIRRKRPCTSKQWMLVDAIQAHLAILISDLLGHFPFQLGHCQLGVTQHGLIKCEARHQVDLSKASVVDYHPHAQTHCLLESWHIQRHQVPLNREKGPMPGLCATLLD